MLLLLLLFVCLFVQQIPYLWASADKKQYAHTTPPTTINIEASQVQIEDRKNQPKHRLIQNNNIKIFPALRHFVCKCKTHKRF